MIKNLLTTKTIGWFLLILFCWSNSGKTQTKQNHEAIQSVELIIQQAESTLERATQQGFAWTTTQPLIAKAKDAQANNQVELAKSLAQEAIKQAENSLKQAEHAANHWQNSVP